MKAPDTRIQLIVGLGNPGTEYERTRHNAGQDLVEELARAYNQPLAPSPKFFGSTARIIINGSDVRLLVPTTFMNRSGQAIAAISQFYKVHTAAILIIHDELDLPPGTAKLKIGGGHGGHNGLRDSIACLGNDKGFARLRIGIGHPGSAKLVANYVLKRAPAEEQNKIQSAIDASTSVIPDLIQGEWEKAMRELHSKN